MARWESQPVEKMVQNIREDRFVLPVIQRSLVWNESKMELLFDSLLRDNSFGGIMVLDEEKGEEPLFAFRRFSREGEEQYSAVHEKLDQSLSLVIDGQQRLQTFYMGLEGSLNGKTVYFNLYGTPLEYEFRFARDESELAVQESDDGEGIAGKLWYSVRSLFNRLRKVGDDIQVANEIIKARHVPQDVLKDAVRANVARFHKYVFYHNTIGIASVTVNKSRADEERRRVVELFRRLNDGGTRLSSLDLAAAVVKGFDHRTEGFFREIRQFADIGISQDEVIKLVFLFQDSHAKEVTDIEASDAKFVIQNQGRIIQALHTLREFLKHAGLEDYYKSGVRSVIPLYFIAYHVYHKADPTDRLGLVYDNYDINNDDFLSLKRWIYLSVLNGVFSRGKGWIPYRTGIRKILNVIKDYRGQLFPAEVLFDLYRNHPLSFSTEVVPERLDQWDRDFVFYLMYDRESLPERDIDHVHPKSRLEGQVPPHKIHSIANFQLLDEGTNRNKKRAKTLKEWLESDGVSDPSEYRKRHLIPGDENTWEIAQFDAFLEQRAAMIVDKVESHIPNPLPTEIPRTAEETPETTESTGTLVTTVDKEALRSLLTEEQRTHPILGNRTTWRDIYKAKGLNPIWITRYQKKLASVGIETVADLALFIMALGLEFQRAYEWGNLFRFSRPAPNGQQVTLQTRSFGPWAWSTALGELQARGFDWRAFLVNPEALPRNSHQ